MVFILFWGFGFWGCWREHQPVGAHGLSREGSLLYWLWMEALFAMWHELLRYVGHLAPQGTPTRPQVGEIWRLGAAMLALWLRSLYLGGPKQRFW